MDIKQVQKELENRLEDMLATVRRNGLNGLDDVVAGMDKGDALNKATDALASGDMLACLIFDTVDRM